MFAYIDNLNHFKPTYFILNLKYKIIALKWYDTVI